MKAIPISFALLALAGCGSSTLPSEAPSSRSIAAIDAIAESALRDGKIPGISIVVMRGERVVHARGYGLADVEHHVPASERTVYLLGSLSKQFWAVAIAQLVEQDRLSVESSIVDVLYNFPDRRVKVKHLVTQTSGLGNIDDNEDDVRFTDAPSVTFEPGTWWRYSNRGAVLVRRLIEQIAGTPWSRYLQDHIAKPLGLASMTTCSADQQPAMYGRDQKRMTETTRTVEIIQFVCADPIDVARFERSLDLGQLLRAETVAKMRTPTEVAGLSLPYGWLTRIAHVGGHRGYGHTGNGDGVNVAAFRFPDDDLTIVVMINTFPPPTYRAWDLVAHIAREELHVPEPELHDRALTQDERDAITGAYVDGPDRAEISARDGHAYLTFSRDGAKMWEGPLVTVDARTFAGGPIGTHPDDVARFLPATGTATAIAVGHPFLLDQLFRRE